ncbi:MAG: methyltransferase domain-containing protein [Candidatus Nealsonbacteria bacterium]
MNLVIIIFFCLFVLLLFLFVFLFLIFTNPFLFWGAIYVSSKEEKIKKIIKLAEIKPGEKAVDLGAGDGRLVIALAKKGAEAHGYEINPALVWRARRNINKAGLKRKAFIHWKNFWNEDLFEFDIIAVYGFDYVMKKLEKKLERELKNNARVVSNTFCFPTWPQIKDEDGVYLYKK